MKEVKSIVLIEQAVVGLEWVLRGNNEPELFRQTEVKDVTGDDKVPDMNGVEGAEIERNTHCNCMNINELCLQ